MRRKINLGDAMAFIIRGVTGFTHAAKLPTTITDKEKFTIVRSVNSTSVSMPDIDKIKNTWNSVFIRSTFLKNFSVISGVVVLAGAAWKLTKEKSPYLAVGVVVTLIVDLYLFRVTRHIKKNAEVSINELHYSQKIAKFRKGVDWDGLEKFDVNLDLLPSNLKATAMQLFTDKEILAMFARWIDSSLNKENCGQMLDNHHLFKTLFEQLPNNNPVRMAVEELALTITALKGSPDAQQAFERFADIFNKDLDKVDTKENKVFTEHFKAQWLQNQKVKIAIQDEWRYFSLESMMRDVSALFNKSHYDLSQIKNTAINTYYNRLNAPLFTEFFKVVCTVGNDVSQSEYLKWVHALVDKLDVKYPNKAFIKACLPKLPVEKK